MSATVHHPKCRALVTKRVEDCTCGGSAFPIHPNPPWPSVARTKEEWAINRIAELERELEGVRDQWILWRSYQREQPGHPQREAAWAELYRRMEALSEQPAEEK